MAMKKQDYNSLIETIYLSSSPETRQQIIEGLQPPVSECLTEDKVDWKKWTIDKIPPDVG